MNTSIKIPAILLVFVLFISSCEINISTANIENVKTCNHLEGKLCMTNTPVFNTKEPVIYTSCNLKNAPENTMVKFVWKYTENENPVIIDEIILSSSDMGINLDMNCSLSKPYNDWPTGKYEIVISIEGVDKQPVSSYFEIR